MSEEKPTALVLDLDGTLLGTDSLWELFFKALSQGRWAPLLWLFCGRLFLKRKLAETTWLDLDLLPWNPGVIRLAQEYHEKGGQVWLATAANQAMAKKVYERFDFFTGYLASDEKINLRSAAKAKALVKLFGQGGYIYAGDSGADPPVWRDSGGAVVVGDEKRAQTAKPLDGEVMIIDPVGTKRPSLKMIFELAQPQNCLQNLLVFVPLLMSRLFYPENFGLAFLALLGFSFITMGGNVLGELYAVEKNRQDLAKKNGTLAAGRLDLSRAGFISLGFMLAALILFTFLGRITFKLILPLLILTYLNEHIFKKNHLAWCLAFAFINALVLASGYKLIDIPISTRLIILFFFATGALGALEMLSKETIKLFNIISFLEIIIKKSMPKVILKLSYYIIFSATMVCFFILFYIIPEISKQNTNELAFLASNPRIVFILTSPERLLLIIPILVYFYARLYSIAFKGQIKKPIFLFLMTDWLSWICLIMVALIYLASGTRFY